MEKMMMNTQTKQRGFSLIELLVAMAILMILAAIALPSYEAYIQRARLENARAGIVDNIKMLEQFYGKYRVFYCNEAAVAQEANCKGKNATQALPPNSIQVGEASKFYSYNIILVRNSASTDSANQYLITASPLPNVYDANTLAKKQLYVVYYSGSASYARCTTDGFSKVTSPTSTTSDGCDIIQ